MEESGAVSSRIHTRAYQPHEILLDPLFFGLYFICLVQSPAYRYCTDTEAAMDIQPYLARLEQNAKVVQSAVQNVSGEQATWKPTPENWSIVEVVNHLFDEERRDFRVRIDYTLHRPGAAWPAINPPQWVIDEKYNERELAASLQNFLDERQASLTWLTELAAADWETAANAPWGVPMRAGDLLAAWTAHDLLHLRQLNELHYLYLQQAAAPYDVAYAGEW